MSFYNLTQDVNKQVEAYIAENMMEADVKETVGDDRAAYKLWKSLEGVVIRKSDQGRFNYYGGGEYVNKDDVSEIGDHVFYSADDSRVAGWLGLYEEDEDYDPTDDFNYVGSRHHY